MFSCVCSRIRWSKTVIKNEKNKIKQLWSLFLLIKTIWTSNKEPSSKVKSCWCFSYHIVFAQIYNIIITFCSFACLYCPSPAAAIKMHFQTKTTWTLVACICIYNTSINIKQWTHYLIIKMSRVLRASEKKKTVTCVEEWFELSALRIREKRIKKKGIRAEGKNSSSKL